MQAGFIGLGTMGASMAANLQKGLKARGDTLVVHDIRREAAARTSARRCHLGGLAAGGGRAERRDLHLAARAAGVRSGGGRAAGRHPEGHGVFRSDDEFADRGAQGA